MLWWYLTAWISFQVLRPTYKIVHVYDSGKGMYKQTALVDNVRYCYQLIQCWLQVQVRWWTLALNNWEYLLCRKLLSYLHKTMELERFCPEMYDFIEMVRKILIVVLHVHACPWLLGNEHHNWCMYILTLLSNSLSLANKMVMTVACSSARFKLSSFAQVSIYYAKNVCPDFYVLLLHLYKYSLPTVKLLFSFLTWQQRYFSWLLWLLSILMLCWMAWVNHMYICVCVLEQ